MIVLFFLGTHVKKIQKSGQFLLSVRKGYSIVSWWKILVFNFVAYQVKIAVIGWNHGIWFGITMFTTW